MTTSIDPGSYTIDDEPWDDFQSTMVPLRTPKGPVTLHFMHGTEVYMTSGYELGEYRGGQAFGNTDEEAFTWRGAQIIGAQIIGAQNFRLSNGTWLPLSDRNFPGHGYGSPHFSARKGRNVTAVMTQGILGYWSEIIRRYVAEHPHIPAHAALRRSVKLLTDQETAIHEAEQQLALMRKARANFRYDVHREFIVEHTLRAPEGLDEPRPYSRETTNGFVVELANDSDLHKTIKALRAAAATEVTS